MRCCSAPFSNQPEVVAKLKEAIQTNAQALNEQKGSKITPRVRASEKIQKSRAQGRANMPC